MDLKMEISSRGTKKCKKNITDYQNNIKIT